MMKREDKISFGNRHLDGLLVNVKKKGKIPDVRGCFSLLSCQGKADKNSDIYMHLELRKNSFQNI